MFGADKTGMVDYALESAGKQPHYVQNIVRNYKDRKCADNENPCSAHIVSVKLYEHIIVLWPFH